MIGAALSFVTRLLVGGHARWSGCAPVGGRRIYFANHASHLDTVILWSALPPDLRRTTHPLAARDYWGKTALRRFIARRGLGAVLIDRGGSVQAGSDPLAEARGVIAAGHSLILFPEGTRGMGPLPGAFRSGLYHLARACPEAELVPVHLTNLARAYPKGAILPAPITCGASFGAPIYLAAEESRAAFLARARDAVCALAPGERP